MQKRILGLLIAAAFVGSAAAQSSTQSTYVTSGSGGMVVTNPFGECWQSGASARAGAGCPPAASAQLAQSSAAGQSRSAATSNERTQLAQADRSRSAAAPSTVGASSAPATGKPAPGYVGAAGGSVVATNPFGLCWRSGAEWSPEKAAEPCDAVPRASAPPPPPPVAAAPAPTPAPTPAPAPIAAAPVAPPPVVIEKVTLSTDVLFEFNKAQLRPSGEQKLDELAKTAQGAEVDKVVVAGFADRIGSEPYNKDLSERRAQAVADYLASKGVDKNRLQIEGYGEEKPITGNECAKMGPEKASNKRLVACLQPDRRVEVELLGSREVARGTTSPAGAGATGAGTSGSTSSGASPASGASSGSTSGSSSSGTGGSSSSGGAAPSGGSGLK